MGQLEQTRARCKSLRLTWMAQQLPQLLGDAENNDWSYLQCLDHLLSHELKERDQKRIQRHFKQAHFPMEKRLDDFDYRHQTTINKRQISALLDFNFLDQRQNLVFIGPPGVGKTHLAIGLGYKAIEAGYRVVFKTAMALVEELELAEKRGELKKRISLLAKNDLLIIDELGYLPMSRQSRYNLFQLVNSLYEYRSIILTTNKDFTDWGEFFHNDNVAIPIVDRIIHHSHIFMLGGESYRLKEKLTN